MLFINEEVLAADLDSRDTFLLGIYIKSVLIARHPTYKRHEFLCRLPQAEPPVLNKSMGVGADNVERFRDDSLVAKYGEEYAPPNYYAGYYYRMDEGCSSSGGSGSAQHERNSSLAFPNNDTGAEKRGKRSEPNKRFICISCVGDINGGCWVLGRGEDLEEIMAR